MNFVMQDFVIHLKQEYPYLTQFVDYSDYKNKIPYSDLCLGILVKLKKDTLHSGVINFTQQDILREDDRIGATLFMLYKHSDSPVLFAIDSKGNKYKAFQNENHQINRFIKKDETIVYNIPLRDLNWYEMCSGVMTLSCFMTLAKKFHYDLKMQNYLREVFELHTTYYRLEDQHPLTPTMSFDEFVKHMTTSYKDLISLNKKTIGHYATEQLQVGVPVRVLENTDKKTWVNIVKNNFSLEQPEKPFSFYYFTNTENEKQCRLENLMGESFKPVSLKNHFLNSTLGQETAVYNIALDELFQGAFHQIFGAQISDLVFVALNRRMQSDQVMQKLFTDISKDRLVLANDCVESPAVMEPLKH